MNFPSLALRGEKSFVKNRKTKPKKLQSYSRTEEGEQEVEQVKRAKEIILCWCANNYDHFHIS